MSKLSRRQFIRGSSAAALGLAATSVHANSSIRPGARVLGANDDLRVGVIGLNGRGGHHIDALSKLDGVRVVALCDVDRNVLARKQKQLADKGSQVQTYVDMRDMFDAKDIDAIACATPNHWHSLCGIWAAQAGKHAYLEKPVSHNIWEGTQLVSAARKYGTVIASGTQSRSAEATQRAIAFARSGELGKIKLARGLCYKPRMPIGKVKESTRIPEHVDYDLWTGPARLEPLQRRRLHYDWHWVLNTGNGDLGNQGIHQMDICRWALGEDGLPSGVVSIGGRLGYDDDGDSPNTQICWFRYETAPVIFEVRGLPRDKSHHERWGGGEMDSYKNQRIGVIIHCEKGWVEIGSNYGRARAFSSDGEQIQDWRGGGDHFANFVEAVRANDDQKLNAPIVEGHLSSAMCHMGLVSHAMGAATDPEQARSTLDRYEGARESFDRFAAHLDANGVDLATSRATLGPYLAFDSKQERFVNDAANQHLSRPYRPGFAIPAQV